MTGDIVSGIEIAGVDRAADAIILQHPCSMRKDGFNLVDRLLVAKVAAFQQIPLTQWATSHYGRMPLPILYGENAHACASFGDIGMVASSTVEAHRRIGCLTRQGINLLQQRFVFYLTRFAIPTFRLDQAAAAVFEEVDLQEDWVREATSLGKTRFEATRDFHEWVRWEDESGVSRQRRLADPQSLPSIRRALRKELNRWTEP